MQPPDGRAGKPQSARQQAIQAYPAWLRNGDRHHQGSRLAVALAQKPRFHRRLAAFLDPVRVAPEPGHVERMTLDQPAAVLRQRAEFGRLDRRHRGTLQDRTVPGLVAPGTPVDQPGVDALAARIDAEPSAADERGPCIATTAVLPDSGSFDRFHGPAYVDDILHTDDSLLVEKRCAAICWRGARTCPGVRSGSVWGARWADHGSRRTGATGHRRVPGAGGIVIHLPSRSQPTAARTNNPGGRRIGDLARPGNGIELRSVNALARRPSSAAEPSGRSVNSHPLRRGQVLETSNGLRSPRSYGGHDWLAASARHAMGRISRLRLLDPTPEPAAAPAP